MKVAMNIAEVSTILPVYFDFVKLLLIFVHSVKCSKLSFFTPLSCCIKINKSLTKSDCIGMMIGTLAMLMETLVLLALPNSSEYSPEYR